MLKATVISNLIELIPDVPADSITSRTIFKGDGVHAILFGFAAGQELSEHTSSYPAVLHFLSGSARVTLGEDAGDARAGTWIHMPPRLPHSIVAETAVSMLLLIFRQDS